MHAQSAWTDLPTIDLVLGAQNGVAGARDELFQRYSTRILGIVRARLGPGLRANLESRDIAQEALIEALQSLATYESQDDSSLIRWLAQIVEHRILAKAKYHGAARRSAAREVAIHGHGPDGESPIEPRARMNTPSIDARHAEEQGIVAACIHDLPTNYRELILLRDYAGTSWEEIATSIAAASPDAARMMHTRARTQLGKLLQARGVR